LFTLKIFTPSLEGARLVIHFVKLSRSSLATCTQVVIELTFCLRVSERLLRLLVCKVKLLKKFLAYVQLLSPCVAYICLLMCIHVVIKLRFCSCAKLPVLNHHFACVQYHVYLQERLLVCKLLTCSQHIININSCLYADAWLLTWCIAYMHT